MLSYYRLTPSWLLCCVLATWFCSKPAYAIEPVESGGIRLRQPFNLLGDSQPATPATITPTSGGVLLALDAEPEDPTDAVELEPTAIAAQDGCNACQSPACCGNGKSTCNCNCCKKKEDKKPNPCATSHKGVFYANDFSYLKDPGYDGHCLGDCLKLMPLGNCGQWGTLDIGGQLRLRYHHERGMFQQLGTTRFEPTENDFLLTRLRLYTNWKINDWARFYAEGIYSEVGAEADYLPRLIDRNYGDFLNLFFDLNLTDALTFRIGRQELLYGNQRLVSPLDWANTRRTFEGVKLMYKQGDWAVDGFFTHFVPPRPGEFDEADYDIPFYGMYAVYSGMENQTVDLYYLGTDNEKDAPPAIVRDYSLHTFGARLNGSRSNWLYEFEGGGQFGRQSGLALDQEAAFATAGIGRNLDLPWSPTVWFYYDYASGNVPGGAFNTFNDLYPLVHKYLGFIDAALRRNIESPNMLLTMNPTEKVNLLFWYYHLMANQAEDIVPSVGGTPPQSLASKDFGDELDIIAKYTFGPRSNILFGWSHFWRGSKILAPTDADFFYTQWELNF